MHGAKSRFYILRNAAARVLPSPCFTPRLNTVLPSSAANPGPDSQTTNPAAGGGRSS